MKTVARVLTIIDMAFWPIILIIMAVGYQSILANGEFTSSDPDITPAMVLNTILIIFAVVAFFALLFGTLVLIALAKDQYDALMVYGILEIVSGNLLSGIITLICGTEHKKQIQQ
jgi:hypothetical protein